MLSLLFTFVLTNTALAQQVLVVPESTSSGYEERDAEEGEDPEAIDEDWDGRHCEALREAALEKEFEEREAHIEEQLELEEVLFEKYGIDLLACECLDLSDFDPFYDYRDEPYDELPSKQDEVDLMDTVDSPSGCLSLESIQAIMKENLPNDVDPGPIELGDGEYIP